MRLRSTTTLIAAALVAGAIAAPAAFAGVYLEPGTHDASYSTTTGPALTVPPLLPAPRSAGLAALNRAKAQELQQIRAGSYHPPANVGHSPADTAAYASIARPATGGAPTVASPNGGFDYGDAAIGAALTAAVALLITAAALAVRRRSQPRPS